MCNCNKGSASRNSSSAPPSSGFHSAAKSKIKKTQYKTKPAIETAFEDEPDLDEITGETFAEKCKTFGYVLGLDTPVPAKVLAAALENPDYAKRLLAQRGGPHLYDLINNPPEKRFKISTSSLITKAGKALLQWGISGFPTVSKEMLQRREDACLACPNLIESTLVLQKITASAKITNEYGQRTGNKSCALCGCVIRNKIRLETESCPMEDGKNPGMNLWGETYLVKE
jgi:hypothetical protein